MTADFETIIDGLIAARKRMRDATAKSDKLYADYEMSCTDLKHHIETIEYLERLMHRAIDDAGEDQLKGDAH